MTGILQSRLLATRGMLKPLEAPIGLLPSGRGWALPEGNRRRPVRDIYRCDFWNGYRILYHALQSRTRLDEFDGK